MKPLIVANWKANKTIAEASEWVEKVKDKLTQLQKIQVVVCSSYLALPSLQTLLSETSVKVGAQNVSEFEKGAYTGEVTAEMLKGVVDYCLVGHSERKKYFGETDESIGKKIDLLIDANIIPVLCTSDLEQLESYLHKSLKLKENLDKVVFVYEPPSAISGGQDYHPETPEKAAQICNQFRQKVGSGSAVLYGGSVNPENITEFLNKNDINGVLPGQASLNPETFTELTSLADKAVL